MLIGMKRNEENDEKRSQLYHIISYLKPSIEIKSHYLIILSR